MVKYSNITRLSDEKGFTIVELLIVVVVIAILAAITIVSYNGITNRAKESARVSDLSTWKKKSELYKAEKGIVCPEGYAFVYGNSALGSSDFCLMKYEARNVGGVPTSQPDGLPWVSVSLDALSSIIPATCPECRIMTESDWMTVAADVLSVKYNWSGGEVGKGFIYSGHNDNIPANALASTNDDSAGYFGTGNSNMSGANQKRTLYLSSGDVIWDLAGNVYERTSGVISGPQPGLPSDSSDASVYSWKEWNDGSIDWGGLPVSSRSIGLTPVPGLSQAGSWNASNGIGRLFSNSNQTATRSYLRGGRWATGSSAGVLTLILNSAAYSVSDDTGFRLAR